MDGWTDSNGDDIPSDWTPGKPLTPADDWAASCGCAPPDGPSIAKGVVITGRPATISAMPWQITLNDGSSPPNFTIDHYDAAGVLIGNPLSFSGVDGSASFATPVYLSRDPVQPLEAATKQYVDENASGIPEAPIDNQTYGRDNGTWVALPASYMPEAPNTSTRFGRFNSTWQPDAIQTDAPNDGGAYARQSAGWTPAVTGGPYLPLAGGTVTGSLTVNNVLTVQGSNSLVLNAPVTGGNQRSVLGMASNVARWILTLGDQASEGVGNQGSNFSLSAYSTTGSYLGAWLTIARADGATTFNGSGVTISGGLAVNGLLALASPNNLAIYGGSAGQVLSTNGSGVLSWATPSGGGGASVTISDTAPASPSVGALWWDSVGGQMYLRYQDPNTTQWTPVVNQGAASTNPLVVQRSQFPIYSVAANGATALDWANGEVQQITLTGAATLSVSGWPASGNLARIVLDVLNTGAFAISGWPVGTKWAGGSAPAITSGAGKQDVVILMTFDGGATILGSIAGQDYR
jgi:hypothetical protein